MPEIEGDGRARVHEHAVAVAAEEERHGLVLAVVLHALTVAQIHDHFLAALVQAGERLPRPEDLLVVLQLENGRAAAAHVPGPPDEGERRVRLERGGVTERLGARQEPSGSVVQLDVPRMLDETELTSSAPVSDDAVSVLDPPRSVGRHRSGEHEGIRIAPRRRRQVAREEAQPNGVPGDERDLEREHRVAIVLGPRELVRPGAHEAHVHLVERVAGLSDVAVPAQQAGTRGGIELGHRAGYEMELIGLLEFLADVHQIPQDPGLCLSMRFRLRRSASGDERAGGEEPGQDRSAGQRGCSSIRTDAGGRAGVVAVNVIAPGVRPARTITSALPLNSLTRSALSDSWLNSSPLSTPSIRASPVTVKRTWWSAVGTATPALSSTLTVTNDRSEPSACRRGRSGSSATRAGAPAVFTSAVAHTRPAFLATARTVPGAYGTRHIRWETGSALRRTPSDAPFRNSSTSSPLVYAQTSIVSPGDQLQWGKTCSIGRVVHTL